MDIEKQMRETLKDPQFHNWNRGSLEYTIQCAAGAYNKNCTTYGQELLDKYIEWEISNDINRYLSFAEDGKKYAKKMRFINDSIKLLQLVLVGTVLTLITHLLL